MNHSKMTRFALLKRIFLVILMLVLILGLLEALCRLMHLSYTRGILFKPDPVLGHLSIPGHYQYRGGAGQPASANINSEGFCDYEHRLEKPSNVTRIAVLGDSFVEALGVQNGEKFTTLLEQKLNGESPQKRFEVFNFGIDGYGTLQEYLVLKKYVLKYKPDLVLLVFCVNNDVTDNGTAIFFPQTLREARAPYSEEGPGGSLRIHPPNYKPSLIEKTRLFLWRRYHFFSQLGGFIERVMIHLRYLRYKANPYANPNGSDFVFSDPYSKQWVDAWKLTERIIDKTRQLSETNGARFALIATDAGDAQINSRKQKEFLDQVSKDRAKLGGKRMDLDKPDKILSLYAQKQKIPCLLLSVSFRKYSRKNGAMLHFRSDFHWNPIGHKVATEAIAGFLSAQGLLKK